MSTDNERKQILFLLYFLVYVKCILQWWHFKTGAYFESSSWGLDMDYWVTDMSEEIWLHIFMVQVLLLIGNEVHEQLGTYGSSINIDEKNM